MGMDNKKILIIEDDADIALIEETYLKASGFDPFVLNDGLEIKQYLSQHHVDLIILDLMLPGKSGYQICNEIRQEVEVPIIMVTARNEIPDKIKGFGLGADDYISKPFDPSELVARVNAHIRQYQRIKRSHQDENQSHGIIKVKDITIRQDSWRVFKENNEIKLPPKEFELLEFLAMHPNIVFAKEDLFEKIWGYDYIGDSATVMVHINRIREKIEDDYKNPQIIETIWGVGYRLNN